MPMADQMNRVSKPLAVVVVFFMYLPLATLAVVGGIAFGWRVPVTLVAVLSFIVYRARATKARGPAVGRARTLLELVGHSLLSAL
jgi:hypothetical protein